MFKGEKTYLFWAGMLILSLASWLIFTAIWSVQSYLPIVPENFRWYIQSNTPIIVGGTLFILIGLFMMKSGVKEAQPPPLK